MVTTITGDSWYPGAMVFRSGAGRLCLDFIRTLRYRGRAGETEELPAVEHWDAWRRQFGLGEQTDPDPDRAAQARHLRESIARLVAAVADSGVTAIRPADLAAVNAAAAHPVPAPHLTPSGSLRRVSDHPGAAVRAVLARDALELVAGPDLARLRRCADPECRLLFVDTSRPGQRRWCAMSGCGNRAKKAEQRARERA
jgi:predicted RNA-binding Zn ribbon-like protein